MSQMSPPASSMHAIDGLRCFFNHLSGQLQSSYSCALYSTEDTLSFFFGELAWLLHCQHLFVISVDIDKVVDLKKWPKDGVLLSLHRGELAGSSWHTERARNVWKEGDLSTFTAEDAKTLKENLYQMCHAFSDTTTRHCLADGNAGADKASEEAKADKAAKAALGVLKCEATVMEKLETEKEIYFICLFADSPVNPWSPNARLYEERPNSVPWSRWLHEASHLLQAIIPIFKMATMYGNPKAVLDEYRRKKRGRFEDGVDFDSMIEDQAQILSFPDQSPEDADVMPLLSKETADEIVSDYLLCTLSRITGSIPKDDDHRFRDVLEGLLPDLAKILEQDAATLPKERQVPDRMDTITIRISRKPEKMTLKAPGPTVSVSLPDCPKVVEALVWIMNCASLRLTDRKEKNVVKDLGESLGRMLDASR